MAHCVLRLCVGVSTVYGSEEVPYWRVQPILKNKCIHQHFRIDLDMAFRIYTRKWHRLLNKFVCSLKKRNSLTFWKMPLFTFLLRVR